MCIRDSLYAVLGLVGRLLRLEVYQTARVPVSYTHLRRTVGTVDVLSKCGIGTFFLGELQTVGRALPCSRTIPHRLGISLFSLSCTFLLMVFRRTQGKVSSRASRFFRRSGQLRFRLPAADMFYLSRGKIFRYRTVTGQDVYKRQRYKQLWRTGKQIERSIRTQGYRSCRDQADRKQKDRKSVV